MFIDGVFACALLIESLFAIYAVNGHASMPWTYGWVFYLEFTIVPSALTLFGKLGWYWIHDRWIF
jgi:hypothetical protein